MSKPNIPLPQCGRGLSCAVVGRAGRDCTMCRPEFRCCAARRPCSPAPIRGGPIQGGGEPPGPEPVSRYMTSVPFVRLIGCVPDPVHWLLNVEPPVKLI